MTKMMKLKSIFSIALGLVMSLAFVSCGDDDDSKTGTDASKDFVEKVTFVGKLEPKADNAVLSCDEMTVTIEKLLEGENLQAVTIRYSGKFVNSSTHATTDVDYSHIYNVAKSGNGYLLTSATSGGERATYGRIIDDELVLNMKLISSGKISAATAARNYSYTGTKQ